ncbi:MAG TPA: TonB-dependent receptor, partial [Chryseolinea sp.]|nr:TonB-dependent receptor [Chryseolinea sp.]
MRTVIFSLLFISIYSHVHAQQGKRSIRITVLNEQHHTMPAASVYLLARDSAVSRSGAANASGVIEFAALEAGKYRARASQAGYENGYGRWIDMEQPGSLSDTITLKAKSGVLQDVTVVARKPLIQFLPDKTVINPEANITNAGATVMDVLEKSPGITVGKDGSIIMKGKPAVNVLIDGKPTQLSGADLQAYLASMSASQVETIELIENPGAKYDASGNAGIINIRTKANRLKGFNGSMNLSIGQGYYAKTGNTLNLNYRNGKVNWFLNYGMRANREKQDLYTLRSYFNTHQEDSVRLEQPNVSRNRG